MSQEMLDGRLNEKLLEAHAGMQTAGELLSSRRLEECYSLFRNSFGPDALTATGWGAVAGHNA